METPKRRFLTKQLLTANLSPDTQSSDLSEFSLPKRISSITFSLQTGQQIIQSGVIEISSQLLYDEKRDPTRYGVLDRRLGVSDRTAKCETCGEKLASCPGHFGYINLELPVLHIGYYKHIQNVLQSICKKCSRILLDEYDRKKYLRIFSARERSIDSLQRAQIQKKILDICRRVKECPRCGVRLGVVKKVAAATTMRLVHDTQQGSKRLVGNGRIWDADEKRLREEKYQSAIGFNPELKDHVHKISDPLNPLAVKHMFERIPNGDLPFIWMHPSLSRPEHMILTSLAVPPVCLRPSVPLVESFSFGGIGTNEDDLTMKLKDILLVNKGLKRTLQGDANVAAVAEHWESLQNQVSLYLNGELPGSKEKALRGLVQRLKGKRGRFRGNLSGKRVDFTARTVISPDPNLSVLEVGVPVHIAKTLTFPERVTSVNIELMREFVRRGPFEHPGACYIRQQSPELVKTLKFGDRNRLAKGLKVGDIVERHLKDNDFVLFNRQPSLHKMSIMCHKVRVLAGRTLRFNLCICAPYNADFDGDEMNLHLPQTEESKAEASELLGVVHNLITPRHGSPLITATQDFFTASFLLTQKNVFFDFEAFSQVAISCGDATENLRLPSPCIVKPARLWTGKQVLGVLLEAHIGVVLSLQLIERNFSKSADELLCSQDGFVLFRSSELLLGNIGKAVLGSSKSGVIYGLIRKYGSKKATTILNRLTKLATKWLTNAGFTIGIDDVTPSRNLLEEKERVIANGYRECADKLLAFNKGTLTTLPGCDQEESLESELSGILSRVRDQSGTMCMQELPHFNKPFVMAISGAKGSPLNICQMISCVGQQIVGGKRMPEGFLRRSLPHFKFCSREPEAKGFVANSFFSGLNAPEFFFHTMGGREGLVDTAVKTAETGYMARRLMKALEDLFVAYDGTVRTCQGDVVQFSFGEDSLNPVFMETRLKPVHASKLLETIISDNLGKSTEAVALSPKGLQRFLETELDPKIVQCLEGYHMNAKLQLRMQDDIKSAIDDAAIKLQKLMEKLCLTADRLATLATQFNQICQTLEVEDIESSENLLPLGKASQRKVFRKDLCEKQEGETKDPEAFYQLCVLHSSFKITKENLQQFISTVVARYLKAVIEPGEAVGAVSAQSLGEPGTQMTLKTFHFAGVASMNVTLGVPRIKEIINATKNISTPIITVRLSNPNDERSARIVQARIEATKLGQICDFIEAKISFDQVYLVVQLDRKAINHLQLEITAHTVLQKIIDDRKLKIKEKHIQAFARLDQVHVLIPPATVASRNAVDKMLLRQRKKAGIDSLKVAALGTLYYECSSLKKALSEVKVAGIHTVHRAVVNRGEGEEDNYHLLVEGQGFLKVLGTPGVNPIKTRTNHIMEIDITLGIEAARSAVMNEVAYIFGRYGLSIDERHLMLLADVMSYKGEILGITRYGIAKMKESVLMLASFEKTAEHLFEATVHARTDEIKGVSECIIVGNQMPVGTGMCRLITKWQNDGLQSEHQRKETWIDQLAR